MILINQETSDSVVIYEEEEEGVEEVVVDLRRGLVLLADETRHLSETPERSHGTGIPSQIEVIQNISQ